MAAILTAILLQSYSYVHLMAVILVAILDFVYLSDFGFCTRQFKLPQIVSWALKTYIWKPEMQSMLSFKQRRVS